MTRWMVRKGRIYPEIDPRDATRRGGDLAHRWTVNWTNIAKNSRISKQAVKTM